MRPPFRAIASSLRSLRVRIALFFVLGLTFALANYNALLARSERAQIALELESRAGDLARRAAGRAGYALAHADRGLALQEGARALQESDVVAIGFYDARGERIARAIGDSSAARLVPARLAIAAGGRLQASVDARGPAPLHLATAWRRADVAAAPGAHAARPSGAVRVVVSARRPLAAFHESQRFGYALLAATLLIGFFGSLLLTQIVVHPLREAGDLAAAVAAGRLEERLPVRGSDELGALASSLNAMADSLQRARAHERAEAEALRTLADASGRIAQETQACDTPAGAFEVVARQIERAAGFPAIVLAQPAPDGRGHALAHRHPADVALPASEGESHVWNVVSSDEWTTLELARDGALPAGLAAELAARGCAVVHVIALPWTDGTTAILLVAGRAAEVAIAARLRLALELAAHLQPTMHAAALRGSLREAFDTLAQAQTRLIHTEKMRATGEMASGIAHDFNNVLGAILARIQLLRRRSAASALPAHELSEALGVMETAARDGADTVRRLRHLHKPEAAEPPALSDLGEIVRAAWELSRLREKHGATEHESRLAVEFDFEPDAWVSGHPSQLREVFTNLILNALDAMPGGGRLRLAVRANGDRVVGSVEDTGAGISPEVQQRIFDPFFTTKGLHGTGLGLSVVYGIVQRHGGEMTVRSEPGEGTAFDVSLPRAAAPDRAPGPDPSSGASARRLHVMVVDDQQSVRDLLADVVRELGHTSESYARAEAALAAYELGRFDVIFTDLGMPGVTGWEFVRLVREVDDATPVVFVTGWGNEVERERAHEAGADDVIAKPFSIEDIARILESADAWRAERVAKRAA